MSRPDHPREKPRQASAAAKIRDALIRGGVKGIPAGHVNEAEIAELGDRARHGLAAENARSWGKISMTEQTIKGRANTDNDGPGEYHRRH